MTREQALQRYAALCREMDELIDGSDPAREQEICNELDTLEANYKIDLEEIES